mmetsp:Transcript_36409/g.44500  ORF Transcript_36409/g.44500 Transcript_36409/m.44500 type:complete len:118 (-) Transcript_36409:148-501(-)
MHVAFDLLNELFPQCEQAFRRFLLLVFLNLTFDMLTRILVSLILTSVSPIEGIVVIFAGPVKSLYIFVVIFVVEHSVFFFRVVFAILIAILIAIGVVRLLNVVGQVELGVEEGFPES